MSLVTTELKDGIGTITLNNDKKRNALSEAFVNDIIAALDDYWKQSVRVVILRANRGVSVWSAGHDVTELPKHGRDPLGWNDPLRCLIRKIADIPCPVIALVEGGVWGGACEVVFSCDIVITSENATFAITPAKLGVPYDIAGLTTFISTAGLHLLKEMIFTAEPIDACRAEEAGIVNFVVPAKDIEEIVYRKARVITQNAPLAIATMKEELKVLANAHVMTTLGFERIQGYRRMVYDSKDYEEGINSFLEKRKPVFKGE